jgi:hypothetical protein
VSLPERIPARTEVPTEDGLFTVEENTYHRDRGSLSCSGAKLLLPPSCPAKFRQRMDNPPEPKPHFDFGSVVHTLTLGAGSDYAVLEPAIHGLKRDGTIADSPTATTAWKAADADARVTGYTDQLRAALAAAEAKLAALIETAERCRDMLKFKRADRLRPFQQGSANGRAWAELNAAIARARSSSPHSA